MDSPKDCRARALQCAELATAASDPQVRDLLFQMAATWLNVATERDRTPGQVDNDILRLPRSISPAGIDLGPGAEEPMSTANTTGTQKGRRWRLRAEECRTLADNIVDQSSRVTLRGIADGYDRLAVQAETRPDHGR